MKRLLFILSIFLVPYLAAGQSYTRTQNYTSEKIYLDATQTGSNARSVSNVVYTDGFGRKLQEIAVGASPAGGDLVTPYVYGTFGRTEKDYLPFRRSAATGAYHTSPSMASNWSTYGTTDQSYAYTATTYDNSPLDRVLKQTGPGQAWHSAAKGVTTGYALNMDNDVRVKKYRVTAAGALSLDGYYAEKTLQKVTIKDEDNNEVHTYVDNQERVLLSVAINGSERLETYNVYDDRGQLRYVLSPEASNQLGASVNDNILQNFAYRYDYDLRGRMIQKRLPGCDPVYMVYDAKDRLVMSQDGKQRTENAKKWSYSLYDHKNRVIETGDVVLTSATTHANLQTVASVSSNYIPSGTRTPLQYTLYDNYTATANIPTVHAFSPVSGYSSGYHTLTTGLVTCTRTKVLDTGTWLTSTTYYDDKGRVIQTISDNLQGYKSQLDMAYDFVGNLLKQRESHKISSSVTDIVETTNVYDTRGRLTSSSVKLNNSTTPATTTFAYDAVGRLTSKTMGSTTETMVYNVRGWLTSKSSTPFKMNLRYQDATTTASKRWNGNIGEWDWQHGANTALMYCFTYDGVNRLTGTVQKQKSGSSWALLTADYVEKGITYDKNGNIKTLQRTAAGTLVDNLVYSYVNTTNNLPGNQLTSLNEAVRTAPTNDIYAPGGAPGGTYTYDKNGNMVSDGRKNLNFSYNYLNLLSEVRQGTSVQARYTWLADGSKLRVRDAGSNGFDYLGSLTYTSSSTGLKLEAANFAGGTIKLSGTAQEINYFLSDHLGSVRVIVDRNGVVKERNDYYPFGAKHVRSDYPQNDNRYDYNGKEEQTTAGLKYLDYGARMYDSALGRWFGVDLLAEIYSSYSPYNYCLGNPIYYIDMYGMWTQTSTGYTTLDKTDISRFIAFIRGASGFDDFNTNDLDLFMQSETSTSRGAVYKSRFAVHFLEDLNVISKNGLWEADPLSLHRKMQMQKEWEQGLNGTAYNQRFFNPVIAAVYQSHSDFGNGIVQFAKDLPGGIGLALDATGTAVSLVGTALSFTGVGAEVGVPLIAIGGAMQTAGGVFSMAGHAIDGNWGGDGFWGTVFTTGISAATGFIAGKGITPAIVGGTSSFFTPANTFMKATQYDNKNKKKK